MYFTNQIKKQWSELLLGDFTPHSMALGLAIGTLISLLPTFGFSALLALVTIFMFPKINRPTIFFALIVWNPLVQIPVYAASFHLGSYLFEGMPIVIYDLEVLNQIYSFTRRFLIAHLLLTLIITIFIYIASRYILFPQLNKRMNMKVL